MRREGWLWILGIVTILGVLTRQIPVILLGGGLFGLGLLAWYWGRHALDSLEYRRTLSPPRAFQGDVVSLDISLANHKWLPVPVVEAGDLLPEEFDGAGMQLSPSGVPRSKRLFITTGLAGWERIGWQYQVECVHRGLYRLGPATLRASDLFGLFPTQREMKAETALIVYPRLRTITELGLDQTMPFGGGAGGDPLFEDRLRIKGTRDYAPGDPPWLIDWKATARAGSVQSRLLDPEAMPQVLVFLDVDTFATSWEGTDPAALEDAVSVAASLAYASAERRFPVGLYSNGTLAETDIPVRLRPSRHPDQVPQMLEMLAKVTPISGQSITRLLEEQTRDLPGRTYVFVVTAVPRKELAEAGRRLQTAGIPASLVYVGRGALGDLAGTEWRQVQVTAAA